MIQLSFKNRIASNYIVTTGLLIFLVFITIYTIVKHSVYGHINNDIQIEVAKHLTEIEIKDDQITLIHDMEWHEREHNTVAVNPVFVQFFDKNGLIAEKSPNLKIQILSFNKKIKDNEFFDTKLLESSIRQIQVPIYQNIIKKGYLVIAMSIENAKMILKNLLDVLMLAYPLILIILFLIARFIAGRSIKPINSIIKTSDIITKDNLKSRIPLPVNQDELFVLSQTINNLLNRIETAVEREKQFTSDASHELRTPLTIIKGTLEVLIRKPRNPVEYEEKISFCVTEVNRLNHLVDQLLLLTRFEDQKQSLKIEAVHLNALLLETVSRFSHELKTKNIKVETHFSQEYSIMTDNYLFAIIINNLISNALKYSNQNGIIAVNITNTGSKITCSIADKGIGISKEDQQKIFNPFFRSKSFNNSSIKGTGLGLSIVKRLADLLNVTIEIESQENKGTTIILSLHEGKLK